MNHRFSCTFVFLLGVLILATSFSYPAHASVAPRVLAFYYAWFDTNTWTPNLVSDLPTQNYNSSDPATIARHIQQAQSTGIDAFVVSWIGTNNPTDTNFKTMLNAAQAANFAATIDFEVQHFGSRDQIVNALSYVRDTFMSQPAFLRDGRRPVIFFWREQNFSLRDWANIRAQVDPNHQQIWIAEGVDIAYQQVFDGHHLYSIAWSPDVNYTLNDWSNRVRRAGTDKLWVATVMPGYDDTRTTRPDRFARTRDNGNFYRATWQAAINSRPDWIIICSFNEWVEGTQIEPSVNYGNLYLDLTHQFITQFKSNTPLPSPTPSIHPTATPTLAPNQRRTTDILRVRAGPGQQYEIIGRLNVNTVIQILARTEDSTWLQIAYPDATHPAWVSSQYVAPQTFDTFPIANVPTPTPTPSPVIDTSSVYPDWY